MLRCVRTHRENFFQKLQEVVIQPKTKKTLALVLPPSEGYQGFLGDSSHKQMNKVVGLERQEF